MKVIFANSNKAWGGGEKWHYETALTLRDSGHEVAIMAQVDYELYKRSRSAGLRTIGVTIGNLSFLNPLVLFRLIKIFRNELPDTVILNLSSDLKAAGIAAKTAGVRNIVYRRGNAKPVKNSFSNRFLFRKIITAIIANSAETQRSILKQNSGLFKSDRIKVLYNGLDLKKYDSLPAAKITGNNDGFIILGSAGRLSEEKGHHLLIEMANLLKQKNIRYRLLIAGVGPLYSTLAERCRKEGLENEIVFTGFIENIKSFMESIDIFILPSLWEGFGYVSIEAMASKKPVVAFNTGSNPEIIDDNKTGFLIKCYDITELTEKVILLAANEPLRKSFGAAGREKVEKDFNSVVTNSETIRYLEAMIG